MFKFWNKLSIKLKIFVFLLLFCFILISFLWSFQILLLDRFYKYIKTNEIKDISSVIVAGMDDDGYFDANIINNVAESYNVCIEIVTTDGYDIYSVDSLKDCIIHKMSPIDKAHLYELAQQSGGSYARTYKDTIVINSARRSSFSQSIAFEKIPEESLVHAAVVSDLHGNKALLLINSIISPIGATVNTLRIQLNYITSFTVLFSTILAIFISKKVSKPIEKINKTAKQLAAFDYDVVFDETGYREINELAQTLNFTAKELSKVENLRRELIANVSHDLRTPLTLISGYAEAIRDLPAESNSESIQIIIDESKRLSTLVADLLDISKLQSGMGSLNPAEYNFTKSAEQTVSTISELIKKDGYTISFIKGEDVYITADEQKISQVIYNLLINAVNYTGDDKMVTVRQIISESHVRLEVTDTGEGIAEENLPYIWDRYFKVEKNHKRSVTGSGLGLSIVKQLIKLHNGDCGVVSEVGNGSMFWFEVGR